ncbi:MAG TPA: PEP-CTERM sorting domain-containing protein [Rariglobus sp.]|jgi:hypothetical protein|nr:PEP-CTERM sorting domain-containing protein [Rariglobus sp.]
MKINLQRLSILAVFATIPVVASFAAVPAIYWDSNLGTAGVGGTGTWVSTSSTKNWATTTAGTTNSNWSNTNTQAIFDGTAGTVTVSNSATPVLAAPTDIIVNVTGYTLNFNNVSLAGMGTLALNAVSGETIIDFGSAVTATSLVFTDSSAVSWASGTILTIVNYSTAANTLKFGTTSSGLTPTQLSEIRFETSPGVYSAAGINASGFVSAIPEPATTVMLGAAAVLGFVVYQRRRPTAAVSTNS